MPRKARLDMPNLLQHVIVRGIEKRAIFLDKKDYAFFCQYLATVLEETRTECFAWALIPNHFHLLVQPMETQLSLFMRRLLTRYAVNFNLRHQRSGHLFQNRYKSIVCEEETYLLELVRYIHLNPLRAGLVPDLDALGHYPWSGHAGLMGKEPLPGQAVEKVLQLFGSKPDAARKNYLRFIEDGIADGRRPELVGGGQRPTPENPDEFSQKNLDSRVLGGDVFLERLQQENALATRIGKTIPLPELLQHVADLFAVRPEELRWRSRINPVSEARAVFCYAAIRLLGCSGPAVGAVLSMGRAAVSRAARRGVGILMEQTTIREKLEQRLKVTK